MEQKALASSELLIYKKTETLLNEIVYPLLKVYPKAEKFVICQEIKQSFLSLLRAISLANNVKSRRRLHQEEADAEVKLLLVLLNISIGQRYINKKKHAIIQMRIVEIGRLLGGWTRATLEQLQSIKENICSLSIHQSGGRALLFRKDVIVWQMET